MSGGNPHHAYLLIGGVSSAEKFLNNFLSELRIERRGNPDLSTVELETFGIEDARALSERAYRKAFTSHKIFFILAQRFTLEAQNALLKTLEEPFENTHFLIAVRTEDALLPTLRSRMQTVHEAHGMRDTADAEKFLSLPPAKRLLFSKKFIDSERNLGVFLDELLDLVRQKGDVRVLNEILGLRRFADDRASSPRLMLEHLALML